MARLSKGSIPLFAADVMLSRLARWLRAAGLDVSYDNQATDDQLVAIFLREKRCVVTRDRGLVRRRLLRRSILIESDRLEEQLAEFFSKTSPILDRGLLRPLSRCIDCNRPLVPALREQARTRVPSYVFGRHTVFLFCSACEKFFWAGTHRDRIHELLERACLLGSSSTVS